MKKNYILCVLAFLFCACSGPKTDSLITFKQVDPLAKIFRESNFLPEFNEPTEVAAGEHATFQLAIRAALPLNDLCIKVSEFKNESGDTFNDATTGFVDYVRVGRQTPKRAKDALNSTSLYYPDPIIEKQHWDVERDVTQPIWVTVNIPSNVKAGNYCAKFTINGKLDNQNIELQKELKIKVYPIVLEKPDLWVTNWFSTNDKEMKILNGGTDVEKYSDRYWELTNKLAEKLSLCYSNVMIFNLFEHIEFKEENGKYTFDYTHFDKLLTIFKNNGILKMIEGGHISHRIGKWGSQYATFVPKYVNGKKEIEKIPISEEKAQNFYSQFIPALYKHITTKFPDVQYAQHIGDEPVGSNIKTYVEIAKFVKKVCPEIKLIEACHTHDLENVLDIWVPQLNFFQSGYNFYKERQAAGDQVWFYTCLGPQEEFANRFIEQPLIKTRLIHWLNFKYNSNGYLHWGFNKWNSKSDCKNPLGETTKINIEVGNVLPGGDAWIVYPKDGELFGSIRLEAMRDGITDYTLLQMYAKKDPQAAKELCRQVVYGWDHYDTETYHFRQIRHQILEGLSKN